MKLAIKRALQKLLGVQRYLFYFALFKIRTLQWDRWEGHFVTFLKLIPDRGLILDIGANIGVMTVLMARKAPHGTIYAFEPAPLNYAVLEKLIRRFRLTNVRTYPWAIGQSDGTLPMIMPMDGAVVLHGISHIIEDDVPATESGYTFEVETKRLDNLSELMQSEQPVSAIKIDVERYEVHVLEGARRLLEMHRPPVYSEITRANMSYCFDLMISLGYTVHVVHRGKLIPYDQIQDNRYYNFVFLP
jgi:FkbM family methyltransferase